MGHKVLLADDSITVQKIVKLSLTEEGIEVIALGNGEQAVQQLETLQPDLVMADVFMPGRDGYEVCEFVKSHPRFQHTPVILLVHAFEPFDPDRAKKVGADQQLTKPFQSIRTLVTAVRDLLAQPNRAEQILSAAPQAEAVRAASVPEPVPPVALAAPAKREEELAVVSSLPVPALTAPSAAMNEARRPELAVASPPVSFDPLRPLPLPASGLPAGLTEAHTTSESTKADFMPPLELTVLPTADWPAAAETVAPELDTSSLSAFSFAPPPARSAADDVLDLSDVLSSPQVSPAPGRFSLQPTTDVPVLSVLPPLMPEPKLPETVELPAAAAESLAGNKSFDMEVGQIDLSATLPHTPPHTSTIPHRDEPGQAVAPGTDATTLLPEAMLEEIVQRVIQRLSTQAIQEIAWEVVPEMAELLLRKQISQQQRLAP